MGSAISGEAYQEILQELEKLDKEKPFNNGMILMMDLRKQVYMKVTMSII